MAVRRGPWSGMLAALLFWLALALFAAHHEEFSHSHSAVSELGAFDTRGAWAWNLLGFILPGVLLALCGGAIARTQGSNRGLLFWLLSASGATFALIGLLPIEMEEGMTSRDSIWSTAHILVAHLSGILWLVGALVLARQPLARRQHPVATRLLLIWALAAAVFYWLAPDLESLTHRPGLVHRVALAFYFFWFIAAGLVFQQESNTFKFESSAPRTGGVAQRTDPKGG